jgi:hypothetical protein
VVAGADQPWGELPDALHLQARWDRVFEGDYSAAKEIMARLDAEDVPNRLAVPDGLPHLVVEVEVMQRWISQARELIAGLLAARTDDDAC